MNYFFKKNHFRLLTILLAISMVITMFAGCQKKDPDGTTPSTEDNLPPGLVEVKPTEEETQPPETTEPDENMAIVKGELGKDQLSVRSAPSSGSKVLGFLDPGTQVEVIKTMTYMGIEWALIREGWVVLDELELSGDPNSTNTDQDTPAPTEPQATEPTNTTKITGKVTANGLYIRKEPSKDGAVVGSYANGTSITILETKNGWGRTEKGWVSMTYVSTNGNNNTTTNNNTNTNTNTGTATADGTTYFVTASELNIREEPSVNGKQLGMYKEGDKIVVIETKNGWGRTEKGWVSMQYAYKTGATGTNTAKGIVTGNGLNVRSGPGTGYDSVATYNFGDRVNILEQVTIGTTTWGCTNKGWISMGYVYKDGTKGDGAGTGTVTADHVNIRSGPGTNYESVGSVNTGDEVEILAQFEYDGTYWGCTAKGWICMDYVGVG